MTVSELILRLETLPQDADVRLSSIFDGKQPGVRAMYFDSVTNSVVLQDHITQIGNREFTDLEGNVYDVPWVKLKTRL